MSKERFIEKAIDWSNKGAVLVFILGVILQNALMAGGAVVDYTVGKIIQGKMKKKYA